MSENNFIPLFFFILFYFLLWRNTGIHTNKQLRSTTTVEAEYKICITKYDKKVTDLINRISEESGILKKSKEYATLHITWRVLNCTITRANSPCNALSLQLMYNIIHVAPYMYGMCAYRICVNKWILCRHTFVWQQGDEGRGRGSYVQCTRTYIHIW
jgi:hypothetical protein